VKDVARLIVNSLPLQQSYKTYNISDGYTYDRYTLSNIVKSLLNKKTIRYHLPLWLARITAWTNEMIFYFNDQMPALNTQKLPELTAENWGCSIERAEEDLQYFPSYDLRQGMRETLEWYKQNKWI